MNRFANRVALFSLMLLPVILPAQILDMPVAVVRYSQTVNIGQRELTSQIAAFQQQLGRELTIDEKQQIFDALINDELLLQAAVAASVEASPEEINNYLNLQRQQWSQAFGANLTDAQFRQQVEAQTGEDYRSYVESVTDELVKLKYLRQEKADDFAALAPPTESQIQQVYDAQATSFTNPAMVSFRHVYIDLRGKSDAERTEARALLSDLQRRIRSGALSFDEVVGMSMDDPEFSSADFGYLLRNDARNIQLLGQGFVDGVFRMERGEISGVMESKVALHIVRVSDKRAARILELGDPILPGQSMTVRQQIRDALAAQIEQEALAVALGELVKELRDESEITVFDSNVPW